MNKISKKLEKKKKQKEAKKQAEQAKGTTQGGLLAPPKGKAGPNGAGEGSENSDGSKEVNKQGSMMKIEGEDALEFK